MRFIFTDKDMPKFIQATVLALLLGGLPAFVFYTRDKVTVDEVREMIGSHLSSGATSQEIESFFNERGINFTYNTFGNWFNAIYHNVSRYSFIDKAVIVHIHVDKDKKLTGVSVHVSYTFL